MQADFRRISIRTDEEMRTVRLARGLRAVAATVIIGGIVIAAVDTVPTIERSTSRDDTADPALREIELAPERIERSMEHHN